MPYASVEDIPAPIKKALTSHQQRIWLAAWNAAHEAGHDEQSCFAIARAAAERGKKK